MIFDRSNPVRATSETIWAIPAYLPYVQPPLTDEAIALAEEAIGHKLPAEYLDLLRKQNGGYIRFELPNMAHHVIAGIGPYYPSLAEFEWSEWQDEVSYPLQGLVPFDGDGHWHLCLDYRKNVAAPSITYADVECDAESHVADSFADYLSMLRLAVDDDYVLEAVSDIEKVKAELSRQLGVTFDAPDIWAHGFSTERAPMGDKRNPQWLWISPNTVPRGFVRPEDPRYWSLKDRMPGSGERFPGLPAQSYILTATNGVRERVLDACNQCGFSVRRLREYFAEV